MRNKGILIMLIFGILASGCAKNDQISISLEKDQTLKVRMGKDFKVKLEANPTTGYLWKVETEKAAQIISEKGKSVYERQNDLVGSGGIEVFTFRALARGSADIVFVYERPWEGTPAKKYVLTVISE